MRDPYLFEEIIDVHGNIISGYNAIDIGQISFIEPYSMLSFLLIGKKYLRNRSEKLRLINVPVNIHQYLMRMDFLKSGIFEIDEILNKKLLLKRSSLSNRILEIVEIPNKERESVKVISDVIEVFRKRARHILKYWLSDNVIDYFVTVISELCQNIFEHSLDSGYLSMQTYTLGHENIVRLVISDSGIGIVKSFENKTSIRYDSSAHLLELALTTPISSKRDFGYGLCQVNTIVEKLKGTIYIRSGNASITVLYNQKGKGVPFLFLKNDLRYFEGTQISISLLS
jgi:hypothetical protein